MFLKGITTCVGYLQAQVSEHAEYYLSFYLSLLSIIIIMYTYAGTGNGTANATASSCGNKDILIVHNCIHD